MREMQASYNNQDEVERSNDRNLDFFFRYYRFWLLMYTSIRDIINGKVELALDWVRCWVVEPFRVLIGWV